MLIALHVQRQWMSKHRIFLLYLRNDFPCAMYPHVHPAHVLFRVTTRLVLRKTLLCVIRACTLHAPGPWWRCARSTPSFRRQDEHLVSPSPNRAAVLHRSAICARDALTITCRNSCNWLLQRRCVCIRGIYRMAARILKTNGKCLWMCILTRDQLLGAQLHG